MAGLGSKLKPEWLKKLEAATAPEDKKELRVEIPKEIEKGYTKVKEDPSISNPRWRKLVR